MFDKRVITVMGTKVEVDTQRALTITDIDKAQRRAAALIGYWGSVWASTEAEKEQAEAFYRQWRAKSTHAILTDDPKMAEWKVNAVVNSHEDFYKFKIKMSQATENAILAKAMFEASVKRANLAQSLGAKAREEYVKTGTATVLKPEADSSPRGGDGKGSSSDKARLKGILKDGKKGTTDDG